MSFAGDIIVQSGSFEATVVDLEEQIKRAPVNKAVFDAIEEVTDDVFPTVAKKEGTLRKGFVRAFNVVVDPDGITVFFDAEALKDAVEHAVYHILPPDGERKGDTYTPEHMTTPGTKPIDTEEIYDKLVDAVLKHVAIELTKLGVDATFYGG